MRINFISNMSETDTKNLQRLLNNAGRKNRTLGIPANTIIGALFGVCLTYNVNLFIGLKSITLFLLGAINIILFAYLAYKRTYTSTLWGYQKSVAKKFVGKTTINIEDSTITVHNDNIQEEYNLKNCYSYYETYYQTFSILYFPNKEIIYIKKNEENHPHLKELSHQFTQLTGKKVHLQSALEFKLTRYSDPK